MVAPNVATISPPSFQLQRPLPLFSDGLLLRSSKVVRAPEYAALVKHIIENEMLNGEVIRLDLLNNPVRAGLVTSPVDYPYLGSDRWSVAGLIHAQQ